MADLAAALRRVLPGDAVLSRPDELRVYDCDGRTVTRAAAEVVVLPRTTEEVVAAVRAAAAQGAAVVPRGAGTGLAGGTTAPHGGLMISTARMNRILSIDAAERIARVEPGVVNAKLSEAARPHGLRYAPDPSSQTACTVGGNVAANSGGPHTLRLGVTTNHVAGAAVVLADGSLLRLGDCGGDGGPEDDCLLSLLVGSEGTCGVIVEAAVRLVPLPESVKTMLASYRSVPDAARAVQAVLGSGVVPAAVEMMDALCVRAVEQFAKAGLPADAGAVLLVELEGSAEEVATGAPVIAAALSHGAIEIRTADDPDARMRLWKARKQAAGSLGRISRGYYTHDICVPQSRIVEALLRIGEVGARHRVRVATLAHAGDGNLHPLFLYETGDADELARGAAAGREALDVCLALGGSLTGEHGVGGEKRDFLPLQYDAATIEAFRRVRRAFDPGERMNPGKVFPDDVPSGGFQGAKPAAGWL